MTFLPKCHNLFFAYSTSTTQYDQQTYTNMYDYDFNSTCDQDLDAATSGSAVVLYYVLFGLGLIGMNKINSNFAMNAYMLCTLFYVYIHNLTFSKGKKEFVFYVFFFSTGNTTVLWLLLRYIKLKTMTDVCLLNLALSDLILAVTLPLWAYNTPNVASCKIMTGVYEVGKL